MCCTGGIRLLLTVCGRAARTISCGCPSRSLTTCRRQATRPVLDEQVPFLKGRPLVEKEDDLYASFEVRRPVGDPLRALRASARARAHARRARPAADRLGRLERRHEPRRTIWAAGRVSGSPGSRSPRRMASPTSVSSEAQQIKRIAGDGVHASWRTPPRSMAGTASGTGGHSTTRGGRWGSRENTACRIDSIAQSWAVISGGGSTTRAERALRAVERELIDVDERLVRLLAPPFTADGRDPGYIGAYPPGIRENGGQYTHAAVWVGLGLRGIGRR